MRWEVLFRAPTTKGRGRTAPPLFPLGKCSRVCYQVNLRAKRPPATKRAPAPSENSEATLLPPLFGNSFGAAGAGAGVGAAAPFTGIASFW